MSKPLFRWLLAPALLAAPLAAQQREPYVEDPDRPAYDEQALPSDDPLNAFEFAIGGDALWFAYRNGLHRGDGFLSLGFLANEDNDLALAGRIMRFAEPASAAPLGLGLGLGFVGAHVDDPNDELFAITITGAMDLALDQVYDLAFPTRLSVEVSYAPDAATFGDGTRVLDVLARVEMDLSAWATAFAGYRQFEVDLDNEDDAELDSALHVGVRLGF
ncbi:MAG: hypothetical protein EXS08_14375 [Planctomycetes bacterium]|nr:hypothetical protein [Planctomycetota bacterium]